MEVGQQFCLRWNNYQSTLQHIFHKLWVNGTFIDVSLVVEGKKFGCHKVVLSACSTYFEQLLKDHGNHPHPLVLLHDLPVAAVESLVTFMYKGEVNVSQEQLTALLKVAETLKIKGLADSAAIANFTKYRLMPQDAIQKVPPLPHSIYQKLIPPVTSAVSSVPSSLPAVLPQTAHMNGSSAARCYALVKSSDQNAVQSLTSTQKHYELSCVTSPKPKRKRSRNEDAPDSLPPSPISLGEPQVIEPPSRSSPPPLSRPNPMSVKPEPEEETDNELQIDESCGNSTSEATESDTHSNQNTPGPEIDPNDADRLESAESLASLAMHGAPPLSSLLQQQNRPLVPLKPNFLKEEKSVSQNGASTRNGERSYTLHDLEEGIERVLMRELTPAKAINHYKIPRRTFFRRLSAVRKSRGIPSSKENASDHFLSSSCSIRPQTPTDAKSHMPVVLPGIIPSSENTLLKTLTKSSKLPPNECKKETKNTANVMTTGNVFSLLTANHNYEYYLKYLKLQNQNKELFLNGNSEEKMDAKEMIHTIDDNRNLASTELPEKALIAQNGTLS